MAHTNGTHPNIETPRLSHWERWQAYNVAHQYLTPASAAAGFTVVKCSPSMRPAFFDLLRLLIARSRLEGQLAPALQQDAAPVAALQEALTAWTAWQRYTVQLAHTFERLAQGHQATLPPLPPEFQTLATAFEAVALDNDEEEPPS